MVTYGSLNLTVTSPVQSFDEPIALAEAKTYLGLPERSPVDPMEDDQIAFFISAARALAEVEQGRDLVRKQWDLSLDAFCAGEIELRDPLVSVDLIQYKDDDGNTHTVSSSLYISDTRKHPGIVMPASGESWPSFTEWPSSAVTIRFTSGYAATDKVFWGSDAGTWIRKGMLYLISGWFNNRIPFQEHGNMAIQEYPFAASCLRYGALLRAR